MASSSEDKSHISLYQLIIPDLDSPITLGITLCTDFKEPINMPTLLSNGINVCIINAKLVVSIQTVIQAIFKTVCSSAAGKMKTKTVSTEILFNLSPYKQIKQSLLNFGIGTQPEKVWVVSISQDPASELDRFRKLTNSRTILQEPNEICDREMVQEMYSVTSEELAIGSLEEAIMNRNSVKDL